MARMVVVTLLAVMAVTAAGASVVLLDEYWAPEITVNEVEVVEVDTAVTGDATQAKVGEVSARLSNKTGAPNVRFRGPVMVRLADLPLGDTEARLWYRTDAWTGAWRFELWVYHGETDPIPLRVLQGRLDGGGPAGALQPDDQWHQARGLLQAAEAYDRYPKDVHLTTYVWLAPEEGWDVPHHTFVDRCELMVPQTPPAPARRVRPRPGAQIGGPGWIWFEGEDAAQQDIMPGFAWGPQNEEHQKLLSNDQWLQGPGGEGNTLLWEVNVAEAGAYQFWCRGNGTSFKWAWDEAAFQECTEQAPWQDTKLFFLFPEGEVVMQWVRLGEVNLAAGKHLLQVKDIPLDGFGLDCWLLTRQPFTPNGMKKPGEP